MLKKNVVLLASARKESQTKKHVETIFCEVDCEIIDLSDAKINPYNYSAHYPPPDNFEEIIGTIIFYDRIVFATPVYWYSMSGLMKNFIDRLTDLVTINKPLGRKLKSKETFLLAVGTDKVLPEGFEIPFVLTSKYFEMDFIASIYFSTNYSLDSPNEKKIIESFLRNFVKA